MIEITGTLQTNLTEIFNINYAKKLSSTIIKKCEQCSTGYVFAYPAIKSS